MSEQTLNSTKNQEQSKKPESIIKHPLSTEKAIRLMESNNELLFVVDKKATKLDVKREIEKLFKAKVIAVNTFVVGGQKRAYVKFAKESPAIDVATRLGMV
ncbi:MAG: 50S ribosomal protein L23 [Candidatus Woesearchaeota archaeon]